MEMEIQIPSSWSAPNLSTWHSLLGYQRGSDAQEPIGTVYRPEQASWILTIRHFCDVIGILGKGTTKRDFLQPWNLNVTSSEPRRDLPRLRLPPIPITERGISNAMWIVSKFRVSCFLWLSVDMVYNRKGIYNQCKSLRDAEFTPVLPDGLKVTCPWLSMKVAVKGCKINQSTLNNVCRVKNTATER